MQIKTSIDVDVTAKAVLRGDKVKLSLSATAPYGERTATVVLEDVFTQAEVKQFESLFAALIKKHSNKLVATLESGRAECITAAARLGEM